MGDNFSVNTIDVNKAGTCYICVHHQSECIDKQNHHSIIIDVAGETQLDDKGEVVQLIGLMLHTTADTKTGRTQYCHGRAVIIPNQDLIFTIGQLYNNFNLTPCQWASRLRDAGETVYLNLMRNNNNLEQWNSILNCQVFVKNIVQHLGLNYPSTIRTSGDVPPVIIDTSILCGVFSPTTTGLVSTPPRRYVLDVPTGGTVRASRTTRTSTRYADDYNENAEQLSRSGSRDYYYRDGVSETSAATVNRCLEDASVKHLLESGTTYTNTLAEDQEVQELTAQATPDVKNYPINLTYRKINKVDSS